MDIVMIGSGNAAAVLGRKFKAAKHKILQIISRNVSAAGALAYEWNIESANDLSLISKNADVYIIAVSDDALPDIASRLKLPGKIVAHTAASVSKEVLKNVSNHYGVFYPLQSLRKEAETPQDIPLLFDGNDETAKGQLEQLAHSISSQQVFAATDEQRMKLHVAAVIVNNFSNHLYALVEEYCKKENIDFRQLLPLIEETVNRIKIISPANSQTGPAIRHDDETIQKHLKLLGNYPALKKIYQLMTKSIQTPIPESE